MENRSSIREGGVEYSLGHFDGRFMQYDFNKMLIYLDAKGKLLFGKKFCVHKSDRPIIKRLCAYIIGDKHSCKVYEIDLEKGIMLTGPVGCGKTSLMKLIPHLVPSRPAYELISTRNVVFSFQHLGYKTIEDYGDSGTFCFDDLGAEPIGRFYGENCNVLGEVLLSRYELFRTTKGRIKTHATTNLNADELEDLYGNRVRSRMRELFNLIDFDKNACDKRT